MIVWGLALWIGGWTVVALIGAVVVVRDWRRDRKVAREAAVREARAGRMLA